MESVANQRTSSCILCKVVTINVNEKGDRNKTTNEKEEDDVTFLFKILLEIPPKPGINLVLDGNQINADHLLLLKSDLVKWCDQCGIAIQQARKLYQQISEVTRKFRKIQRKVVETVQNCITDDNASVFNEVENYKAIWRKLCLQNEGRFNKFEYPFTVLDWMPLSAPVPEPTGKKDTSSCLGDDGAGEEDVDLPCKTEDVKTEDEDNEQVEALDTKQQRILLILPKNVDHSNNKDNDTGMASPQLSADEDDGEEEAEDDDEEEIIETNQNEEDDEIDPLAFPEDSMKKPDDQSESKFKNIFLKNHCSVCKKSYTSKDSLTAHQKRYHSSPSIKSKPVRNLRGTTPNFQCTDPLCRNYFKTFTGLRLHMKNCHPHLPSPPSLRKRSTFHKKYPELFSKIVRNPTTKLYTCPYSTSDADAPCEVTSSMKRTIEVHVQSKHLGDTTIYPCTWGHGCTRTFSVVDNYHSHMDRHRGTPKFKCDQCDKQFYSRNPLVSHKQREHEAGTIKKSFVCEMCGKGFSCRDYLYSHKSTVCRSEKVRKSTTPRQTKINKSSPSSSSPTQASRGSGSRQMCHLCPKSFKWGYYLKEHLKTHEDGGGIRWSAKNKFQCDVKGCRLRFRKKELLENHVRKRHGEDGKGEPEFKCQYCGKGFYLGKNLKHHEETHENEGRDPYKCQVCGKGFRTMTYLRYHQKHTHKMKLEDGRVKRWENK